MTESKLVSLIRVLRTKELLLSTADTLLSGDEINREKLAARLLMQCEDLNFVERDLDKLVLREITVPLNVELAKMKSESGDTDDVNRSN